MCLSPNSSWPRATGFIPAKVLLWTDPATTLTIPQPSRGRSPGMMQAHGPGHIGVAENRAGEVIALPLRRAQPACVRPRRFLCATGNVKYQWQPSAVSYTTMAAEREDPAGRYQLNLTAAGRQGLALLHASGDAFTRDLADSETVLVSPASLLYWEDTVDLSSHLDFPYVPGQHVRRVFWRSSRIWLRVCGPGRPIDSACGPAEDARTADVESFASWQRWDAPAITTTRAE
jgi:Mitochondrial biogenesis AIM24